MRFRATFLLMLSLGAAFLFVCGSALPSTRLGGLVAPPSDWAPRIEASNMLFSDNDKVPLGRMPSVGNGFLGSIVGSNDMFVAGVYNGASSKDPSHRARVPATLSAKATAPSARFLGAAIDLERAVYLRRISVGDCVVEQRLYCHQSRPSLMVLEIEAAFPAASPSPAPVIITLDAARPPATKDFNFKLGPEGPGYTSLIGPTLTAEFPGSPLTTLALVTSTIPQQVTFTRNTTLSFFTAIRTSLETSTEALMDAALADYTAATASASSLFPEHTAAWKRLWQSGVELSGRPDVSRAINASLYAILSSIREDRKFSLAPGGLTQGYNGHVFWDTETWMYPPLLLLHPTLAEGILDYRYERRDGARNKAKSYSPPYAGTMFPWESAFTGDETTPTWAGTGLREIHISGDIAFAVWQYWQMTQNMDWLDAVGYPLLEGIADFWMSRVSIDAQGRANINGVIPPDEYADPVDNSVYTNTVAVMSLRYATRAAGMLGKTASAEWERIASRIPILFDETQQIHPEFEGYKGQKIKQADVVLLGFPLVEMPASVRRNDLEYYGPRTDFGGPAMTWGMHAVGFLELRDFANANANFNRSFANVQQPYGVWTETPLGGAQNFITGAGGFLQGVMFGWGGLRITDEGLRMQPLLMEGATSARIRSLSFLGSRLILEWTASTAALRATAAAGPALCLRDGSGRESPLDPAGRPLTFPAGQPHLLHPC